jgi:predicted nuclease of predicted toxin-antitoxin system
VKFLVDQNLSPTLVALLRTAGHDVVHTGDIDLAMADDRDIVKTAAQQDRVIVSADTDFGTLLAERGATSPSVVLLRLRSPRRARQLAELLLANLDAVVDDLDSGAIVVLEDERIRVRRLPI